MLSISSPTHERGFWSVALSPSAEQGDEMDCKHINAHTTRAWKREGSSVYARVGLGEGLVELLS